MKLFNWLTVAGGIIGGSISYLLGGWDSISKCLVLFILLDWFTGLSSALYNGHASSQKGFKGVIKMVAKILAVFVSAIMQDYLALPVRDFVVMFFVLNDGLSIVENLGEIIEMPPAIKRALESLRGDDK